MSSKVLIDRFGHATPRSGHCLTKGPFHSIPFVQKSLGSHLVTIKDDRPRCAEQVWSSDIWGQRGVFGSSHFGSTQVYLGATRHESTRTNRAGVEPIFLTMDNPKIRCPCFQEVCPNEPLNKAPSSGTGSWAKGGELFFFGVPVGLP